jgi:hypothetical protein
MCSAKRHVRFTPESGHSIAADYDLMAMWAAAPAKEAPSGLKVQRL